MSDIQRIVDIRAEILRLSEYIRKELDWPEYCDRREIADKRKLVEALRRELRLLLRPILVAHFPASIDEIARQTLELCEHPELLEITDGTFKLGGRLDG